MLMLLARWVINYDSKSELKRSYRSTALIVTLFFKTCAKDFELTV